MISYSKIINLSAFLILSTIFLGCTGESVEQGDDLLTCTAPLVVNSAGNECVQPEAISCVSPLVPNDFNDACVVGADPNAPIPTVFPAEDEAILYYNRANKGASNQPDDPSYDGYVLHTWNTVACDSYDAPFDQSVWGDQHVHDGVDPNYGAYWILKIKEEHTDCANFIIHIGTDDAGKETDDNQMNLVQDDAVFTRMNWAISGHPDPLEFPITELGPQPLDIENAAAHWIDANTIVWNLENSDVENLNEVRLHHSSIAGIEADLDNQLNGTSVVFTTTTQTPEQEAMYPLTAGWEAFTTDASMAQVKNILKNELVVAAYDAEGNAYKATYVQAAKVLDDLYTSGEADADEASLGVIYEGDAITANLWAPTAQNVMLNVYDANKELVSENQMTEDPATGIWTFAGTSSLDRQFFRYVLTVYHSQNKAVETIWSTDPYSVSLSTNGLYSQFVNLSDDDLKPEGWEGHAIPTIADFEDAVIYEGHVRDFSVSDDSTTEANRGKYMAFTETGSVPMTHLAELAANGLTHFQMLPINDIASIGEDPERIVNITDTVADLCAINAEAPVCGVNDDNETLISILEGYLPFSTDAQALVESMRGLDSFNWGYDPKHFNAPDGIYSSNADGVARIVELRSMIKALHETGLRVSMDVVYNHTNSGGLWDNSVLDKVVPGYYHSRDLTNGGIKNTTCCSDSALEHRMMDKLMSDSLAQWATQYSIDGFRFDLMSHGSRDQMLRARDIVQEIDEDTFFYGEGWPNEDRGFVKADQFNMAGSEIATFNDRLRDGVRFGALFNEEGDLNSHDIVRLGLAGTLADYVLKSSSGAASTGSSFNPSAYGLDPADIINYVSKHDDRTLWDQLQFSLESNMPVNERVRVQNIAATIPLMSQGIPFLQMGGDLIRSKSLDRNTFDAGDWFNKVDFTMEDNNWNVGLPLAQDNGNDWEAIVNLSSNPNAEAAMSDIMFASTVFKEFLSIRRDSKLFRLTSAEEVIARVGFHNIGRAQTEGLIVMSIDDGVGLVDLDPANDAIVVVVNGSDSEQSHTISTATGFTLHAIQLASVDSVVTGASFTEGEGDGTFTVPARTTAVFVKTQGAEQGEGLSALATAGAPDVVPYGDTTVFVRGEMNGWGEGNPFEYKGAGVYQARIELAAETTYEFKIASADWSTVDFGAVTGEEVVVQDEDKTLTGGGANMTFTSADDAIYVFQIDAVDSEAPILNVSLATTIYVRGGINDWGAVDAMTYLGNDLYSGVVNVGETKTGIQEFKIASEDWSTVDFGSGEDDAAVTEGVAEFLAVAGSNMSMDFTETGNYTFLLDLSDSSFPTLTVNKSLPIFLRGDMNGWGEVDELVFQGDATYSVEVDLSAQSYGFKLASADWSSFDFGSNVDDEAVVFGNDKPLVSGGENMSVEITNSGVYRFELVAPNGGSPTMTVLEPVQ